MTVTESPLLRLDGKLVTIFGGGGFLGRYIAQALFARGARVRIAQRRPGDALAIRALGNLGQTQYAAADITDPVSVARAVQGSDAVINLVGIRRGSAAQFQAAHVDGARLVAEAAAKAGVAQLIHMGGLHVSADSPSAYSRTKAEGEAAVRRAFPGADIVRASILIGPESEFLNMIGGMVARMPVVPVVRSGWRFQPVFVGDVAEAMAAMVAAPSATPRSFAFGGPEIWTMGQFVRWLSRETWRKRSVVNLPDVAGSALAAFGFLPGAPLTKTEYQQLHEDNVVAADGASMGFAALGIVPRPIELVLQDWVRRNRPAGRFTVAQTA